MDNKKKLVGVDLCRIIAATLIVFHHYQQVFHVRFPFINFFGGHFYFGFFVEFFFIISGFLTEYTKKKQEIGKAFIYKLLRIYPMATISCAYTLIVKSIASDEVGLLWNAKTLIANFMLVFSGWPVFSTIAVNSPEWYLCVLIQCYIVYFLSLWISNKTQIRIEWISTLIIITVVILFRYRRIPWVSYRGFEVFFLGVLLAKQHKKAPVYNSILIAVSVISFVTSIMVSSYYQRVLVTFITFPSLMILMSRLSDLQTERIQSYICRMGRASFEAFLWHYPLMASEQMIQRLTGIEIARSYTTMVLFTIFVWIFACEIYRLVEKPLDQVIRKRASATIG